MLSMRMGRANLQPGTQISAAVLFWCLCLGVQDKQVITMI